MTTILGLRAERMRAKAQRVAERIKEELTELTGVVHGLSVADYDWRDSRACLRSFGTA